MPTPLEALRGVVNPVQVLPHLLTSGQPSPAHFRALREAGVEVVLDIRDPMEPRGFDQPALMRELGFDYVVVAVNDGTLSDDTLDRILEVLRKNRERPTLFHCNSGNRVGGAMIPFLMLDEGMTEDEATMAAMRMGLRGAGLLEWGREYAERKGEERRTGRQVDR
jgi:protein tyrosine phosphatase (PTP) superfamily phosphohydrolase (DUF442 family)